MDKLWEAVFTHLKKLLVSFFVALKSLLKRRNLGGNP